MSSEIYQVAAPGKWIAHPADRLKVARALSAPLILFAPFVISLPLGGFITCAVAAVMLVGDINHTLHLHVHRPFTRSHCFNLVLDLVMGVVSGMTSSNWRIQHIHGHHRGQDIGYRPSLTWELERYSPLRALSFCLRSIGPTFYAPLRESFRKGVLKNTKRPINYRWAFSEQALLIGLVASLSYLRPATTWGYLLPWYGISFFMTRYVDYLNHYGCDQDGGNVFIRANNSLAPWYNRMNNNFGYHTAHHIRPDAHWTELPVIHQQIFHKIPASRLKTFGWSFLLMPYHFYLSQSDRT